MVSLLTNTTHPHAHNAPSPQSQPLTSPIEGGDSGAWVFDSATGQVCGHVLAYSSASSVAYIAPMEVLLDDMVATLGATVTLPLPEPTLFPPLAIKSSRPPSLIARLQCPAQPTQGSDTQMGVGLGLEAGVENGSAVLERAPSSPPMATSPPLVRDLSALSLEGMGQRWDEKENRVDVGRKFGHVVNVGKGKGKGCVLIGGGMEEGAGKVKARG